MQTNFENFHGHDATSFRHSSISPLDATFPAHQIAPGHGAPTQLSPNSSFGSSHHSMRGLPSSVSTGFDASNTSSSNDHGGSISSYTSRSSTQFGSSFDGGALADSLMMDRRSKSQTQTDISLWPTLDMPPRSMTEQAMYWHDQFIPGGAALDQRTRMARNYSADHGSTRRHQPYAYIGASPYRRSESNVVGLQALHATPSSAESLHSSTSTAFSEFDVYDLGNKHQFKEHHFPGLSRPLDAETNLLALPEPTGPRSMVPSGMVGSYTPVRLYPSPPQDPIAATAGGGNLNHSPESSLTMLDSPPDHRLSRSTVESPTYLASKPMQVPTLPHQDFTSEAARWKAVQERTHAADAHFVCAHLTTHVYCRPSCVAKKPERLRTTYFTFPGAIEAADQAGFRPCKRCKPEIPGTADNSALAVGQCVRQIVKEAENAFSGKGATHLTDEGEFKTKTLKEYSKMAGLSPFHFHRCFKAVAAITPGEFVRAHTALTLQDRLGMDSYAHPLDAAQVETMMLGWTIRRARKTLGGALPTMYARGCQDMEVQAIQCDTTAGKVAFAFVEFGLDVGPPVMLACMLGEDAVSRVAKRFPGIKIRDDPTGWLRGVVDEVMKHANREVQLPSDSVPHVRRARIAVALRDELEAAVARHRAEQKAQHANK